ncbi:hypothetical protein V8E36_004891 [Tilletia maclaganii]
MDFKSEVITVSKSIATEQQKDQDWERSFDAHKQSRARRTVPLSKRSNTLTATSRNAVDGAYGASASGSRESIPVTDLSNGLSASLLGIEAKVLPTGPSLLKRIGTIVPTRRSVVERAGQTQDTTTKGEGSSRDLELALAQVSRNGSSLQHSSPTSASTADADQSDAQATSSDKVRKSRWDNPEEGKSTETKLRWGQPQWPHRVKEEQSSAAHSRIPSSDHRQESVPSHSRSASMREESGRSSSKHVHRPRDSWEAPCRDVKHRERRQSGTSEYSRIDTYISSPFLPSDPAIASSSRSRHSTAAEHDPSSSSQHDRTASSSTIHTYGGPMPSPPPQPSSALAPAPPSLRPPSQDPEQLDPKHAAALASAPKVVKAEAEPELWPLPHELPFDPQRRNWIMYPPPKGKGAAAQDSQPRWAVAPKIGEEPAAVKDPRLKLRANRRFGTRGRQKAVQELQIPKWSRDANSVGPPPPTAIAVSGWDDSLSYADILRYFQPLGRIAESLTELDKYLGTKMPFVWIRYCHDFDDHGAPKDTHFQPQDGAAIVLKAIEEFNNFRLPGSAALTLRVRADDSQQKYWAAYNAELSRRHPQRAGPSGAVLKPVEQEVHAPLTVHKLAHAHAHSPLAAMSPYRSHAEGPGASPSSSRDAATIRGQQTPQMHWWDQPVDRYANVPTGPAADRMHAPGPGPRPQGWHGLPVRANEAMRWGNSNGHPAPVVDEREYTGVPKGPRAVNAQQTIRVGRLGGIPPSGPKVKDTKTTEEIMRMLANLGRPYMRWPKGSDRLKFSELKGMFNGMANISMMEQDDRFMYCCLKSDQLTKEHMTRPYRMLRGGERVELELCPAIEPFWHAAFEDPHQLHHHHQNPDFQHQHQYHPQQQQQQHIEATAKEASKVVLGQLKDAIVSSAKQHADHEIERFLREARVPHAAPHPAAPVLDPMAVLASTSSMAPALASRAGPLPSIRRREYVPDEEEELEPPPTKLRRVSGRPAAREQQHEHFHNHHHHHQHHDGQHHLRGSGKASSPASQQPLAQATPTESTRMDDSDDDEGVGGIKDDETQTTEDVDEDERRAVKSISAVVQTSPGPRGVKRSLKQIFSSDEEDDEADEDVDVEASRAVAAKFEADDSGSDSSDDSSVSKKLVSFKQSPKRTKKPVNGRKVELETDDLLASMLLETVSSAKSASARKSHSRNTQRDEDEDDSDSSLAPKNTKATSRSLPPKAAAKASKKAKTLPKKALVKVKSTTTTKPRPEHIDIQPAALTKPEIAQAAVKPAEPETPSTESIPPTPTEAGAAVGAKALSRKADPRTKKSRRERARSPSPDPFALQFAHNEEDLYFLRLVCERIRDGLGVSEDDVAETGEDGALPAHASGAARTEGYYKIPASQKAAHLPDRNTANVEETTAVKTTVGTARGNRAESRRVLMNIELHKKESATDTDILKFNQLSARKKQLRFAKSPIHDWGLYAMELIPAGDMVIEYVGEVIRQQVADEREKRYERQGQFSTYLFRVDDELVVDATMKGNIARLMNHCCTPNCTAKILTVNGEKRIALFAKSTIHLGEELTYDYKFQSTGDDADQIACLCGSANCRKFL